MAKPSCKCKKSAECEECPEWIFTFADLVMLMMGFFVILWVLKPNPNNQQQDHKAVDEKWLKMIGEIRAAFGYTPDPSSKDPVDMQMLLKQLDTTPVVPKGAGDGGQTTVKPDGAQGTDPEVTTIRNGRQATVGGRLLFENGSAQLTTPTTHSLEQIAEQIRGHYNIVIVKGHTSLDDFPDGTSPEQKMDLSLKRAQAVADFLTGHGVDPAVLRVQGCSTFEPVIQRTYTPDAQLQNRRVEVESTATLLEERQDHPSSATTKPLVTAP